MFEMLIIEAENTRNDQTFFPGDEAAEYYACDLRYIDFGVSLKLKVDILIDN